MSHNAYIRGGVGSGNWTGVTLTFADFENFDTRQYQSINGDQGGTWAPAAVITIGGLGIDVTGAFTADVATFGGLATFNNIVDFQDIINANQGIAISSGGTFVSNATDNTFAGPATFNGNVQMNGVIQLFGNTGLGAGITFTTANTSAMVVAGSAAFSGAVSSSGTFTNTGVIASSGAGHFRDRAVVTGADILGNYSINDGDVVYRATAITANTTWTVTTTGAANGDRMMFMFTQPSAPFQVTLKNGGGTTLGIFAILTSESGHYYQRIDLLMVAGAWVNITTPIF